jgi:enoyl reductase
VKLSVNVLALLSLVCLGVLAPQAAYAGGRGEEGNENTTPAPDGNATDDGTLSATAGAVVFDHGKNGSGSSAGAVTSTTTWTPPACYYAPKYTPAQLKKYLESIWGQESTGSQWDLEQRNKYESGGKTPGTYEDFNKAKTGKGYWWDSYVTPGREGDPGAIDCDKSIFWVDKGETPPADIPQAITPEMLAQLAYAEIRVPSTKVQLAPEDTTKVNLPTWAWLDAAKFKPVSVTASVPLLGIEATTTAEPVSLRIEPGTADATTYPASGVCEISDGRIGEAYAKGKADETPSCGVRYLRSSGDGSYKLKATITWKIHWTGTGVNGEQALPDGTWGAEQDVVVQEIQAVNR